MDKKIIQPDGSLRSKTPYIYWELGAKHITLDADFSIEDLIWIVDHMSKENSNG